MLLTGNVKGPTLFREERESKDGAWDTQIS